MYYSARASQIWLEVDKYLGKKNENNKKIRKKIKKKKPNIKKKYKDKK